MATAETGRIRPTDSFSGPRSRITQLLVEYRDLVQAVDQRGGRR